MAPLFKRFRSRLPFSEKRIQYTITSSFILFIFTVSIWNLCATDQPFSEQENRPLSQQPPLTLTGILSGKFMSDYEAYLSDQFAGKIGWITLKAHVEQWLGKHETNGIFVTKDGFLLEKFTKEDDSLERNLELVMDFSKSTKGRKVSLMLVPTSVEFYKEKLPLFAQVASQEEVLETVENDLAESVQLLNIYSALAKHLNEAIYFKSDHHWTMRGAYYAYAEAAVTLGFTPYSLADFSRKEVSTNFFGTYAAKAVGFPIQPDTIEVFHPRFPVQYTVSYGAAEEVTDSLYHWSALQKRDQYSLFLNGNHRLLTIQSHVKNGRKLAVLKDSYANVFIPFLANHYEEIHVIDLRYFHSGLNDYLEENNLDDILLLYNIPNFITDTNLLALKY